MEKTTQIIAKIALALCLLCTVPFAQLPSSSQLDYSHEEFGEPAQSPPSAPAQPPAVPAQSLSGKPKIAVYVSEQSGYSGDVKNALRVATMNVLVRDGEYEVVERSSVIDEELSRQASGAVDDDQMVKFGRQAGARYVCVSDITTLGNYRIPAQRDSQGREIRPAYYVHPHQVSARIIDVETAQLVGLGVIDQDIQNGPAMSAAITKAVEKMLETISDKTDSNLPKKAVYIQGGRRSDQRANALYTYTLEALFTRSRYNGDFVVVERSEAFTRQIDREHGKQRSGSVADSEISRMGKQYGIAEICIASIESVMGTYNINARLVNVERASVVNASQLRHLKEGSEVGSLNNLRTIAVQMVEDMIPRKITEAELEEERRRKEERDEVTRTAWMGGFAMGGGVSLNMNDIEPNYYESLGGQFVVNAEFYKQNLKFFRFGLNADLGSAGINRDAVRRTYPNTDGIASFNIKLNASVKLYPVDFLFLSGGAGWAWYDIWAAEPEKVDVVKISTPVFPVGGGIVIGPGGNGVVIEVLYNIIPFQGRTAAYMSINAGFKGNFRITEEKKEVRQII